MTRPPTGLSTQGAIEARPAFPTDAKEREKERRRIEKSLEWMVPIEELLLLWVIDRVYCIGVALRIRRI